MSCSALGKSCLSAVTCGMFPVHNFTYSFHILISVFILSISVERSLLHLVTLIVTYTHSLTHSLSLTVALETLVDFWPHQPASSILFCCSLNWYLPSSFLHLSLLDLSIYFLVLLRTHSVELLCTKDRPVADTSTCTTHNTHKRQPSVPLARVEPSVPASKRPQTHALDRATTRIGQRISLRQIS